MDDQAPMFDRVPKVTPKRQAWTCTRCGAEDTGTVHPDLSRPSLDERYALGYCDDCSPSRKGPKGSKREHVPLIQSHLFDRPMFLARARAAADAKLLRRYRQGHALTVDELAEVQSIIARLDRDKAVRREPQP